MNAPTGSSSVPQLAEAAAKAQLVKMFSTTQQWVTRMGSPGGFTVGTGSALSGDDAAVHTFPVSTALVRSIGSAIDHLHGLYALTLTTGFLHASACGSAARGALECACTAIWIAEPASRDLRIQRALSWYYQDMKDGNQAAVDANIPVPTPLPERKKKLNDAAAARGLPDVTDGYQSTATVKAAKSHLGSAGMDVLLLWRLCSAYAHGRLWTLAFDSATRTPVPGRPDMVSVKCQLTYAKVLTLALVAEQAVQAAIALYDQRALKR